MNSPGFIGICLATVLGGWGTASVHCPAIAQDLARQVRELFAEKCFECHGAQKQKGELRLDSRVAIEAGGHTGNALIGEGPANSEILRRVQSSDPDFRMPADGEPLTPQQIELIETWLAAGAPFPDDDNLNSSNSDASISPTNQSSNARGDSIDQWTRRLQFVRPLIIPFAIFCLLVLIIERSRRSRQRRGLDPSVWHRRLRRWYLPAVLAFGLIGLWLYHRAAVQDLSEQLQQLEKRIAEIAPAPEPEVHRSEYGGPMSIRPRHPQRMGGVYYRGNDERDPRLFNGGIYRTATMRIWLADQDLNMLDYGSDIGAGQVSVILEIERAAQATPQLFTDTIMNSVYLSRQIALKPHPELEDVPERLAVITPGEKWRGEYPLDLQVDVDNPQAGVIYVYKARNSSDTEHGKPHYCIRYDIQLEDNQISPRSELWMGALSTPFGLQIPQSDEIQLDEWFSSMPIHEIQGENSDDPALLGVPEFGANQTSESGDDPSVSDESID